MKDVLMYKGKKIRSTIFEGQVFFAIRDVVLAVKDTKDLKSYIKNLRKNHPEVKEVWREMVHTFYLQTTSGEQPIQCTNRKGLHIILKYIRSDQITAFKKWLPKAEKEKIRNTLMC
mgnify:CR=1 FL=1